MSPERPDFQESEFKPTIVIIGGCVAGIDNFSVWTTAKGVLPKKCNVLDVNGVELRFIGRRLEEINLAAIEKLRNEGKKNENIVRGELSLGNKIFDGFRALIAVINDEGYFVNPNCEDINQVNNLLKSRFGAK